MSLRADAESEEALVLLLHECGTLGIETIEGRLIAWFDASRDPRDLLDTIRSRLGSRAGAIFESSDLVPDGRWHERWLERLRPMRVGRRLLILPGPEARAGRARGRAVVRLTPGRAFGTGEHATTRLCLEMIERTLRPGDEMLDLGTGSGILAIAARRLGARLVVALDIDPEAAASARSGAVLNGLSGILVAAGGTDALLSRRFDLVAANLTGEALLRLLPDIAGRTRRAALLSGILQEEASEVLDAARSAGLSPVARRRRQGWCALHLERAGP